MIILEDFLYVYYKKMIKPILPLRSFFSIPYQQDIDLWSIYKPSSNKIQIKYNKIIFKILESLYRTKKQTIFCSISGKELIVYNNYPLIRGILIKTTKRPRNIQYLKVSRSIYLYVVSEECFKYLDPIIKEKCKIGRIYEENVLLHWLNIGVKMNTYMKRMKKRYKSIFIIQRFYRNIIRKKIEWINIEPQLNEEKLEEDNRQCLIM